MTKFEIDPRIIVPRRPVIQYARVDLLETSHHARIGFEVFLAISMMLAGVHLGATAEVPVVHKFFEAVSGAATIIFALWSYKATQRALNEGDEEYASAAPPPTALTAQGVAYTASGEPIPPDVGAGPPR